MTGQRMEIAKATVEKILDTLSDDDFFNIIWVNNVLLLSPRFIVKNAAKLGWNDTFIVAMA